MLKTATLTISPVSLEPPTSYPIVTVDKRAIPDRYASLDALASSFETNWRRATHDIGPQAASTQRLENFGAGAGMVASGLVALGTGVAFCLSADSVQFATLLAATYSGLLAGCLSAFATVLGPVFLAAGVDSRRAKRSIPLPRLEPMRHATSPAYPLEAAATGELARQWVDSLDKRRVKGIDARALLFDLEHRGMEVAAEDRDCAHRWLDLRAKVGALENTWTDDAATALIDAFATLPDDERAALGPLVHRRLFDDRRAPREGLSFSTERSLIAALRANESPRDEGMQAFEDALGRIEPKAVTPEDIDLLLACIAAMAPEDAKAARARAAQRYFRNGAPAARLAFDDAERFSRGVYAS